MAILLTGKTGQLGSQLHRLLACHNVKALGRDELDLGDPIHLAHQLRELPNLDLIVNAAAYTAVDHAETNLDTAFAVNAAGPAVLAEEAKRRNIPIIHFSTDYVFDGNKARPYTENDSPHPISVYGQSKFEGEYRIKEIWHKYLIIRVSGMYDSRHTSFLTTMMKFASSKKTPRVVRDQIVSPNYCPCIAKAVNHVIHYMLHREIEWGTYHLSGTGETNWYEFACWVFEHMSQRWGMELPIPVPVSSQEFGAKAKRPAYSVLDSTKFERIFQTVVPFWKEQFHLCMEDMFREINENVGERS